MKTGTVKWFDDKKGFGFIAVTGEDDAFVHYRNISTFGHKTLIEGQEVKFSLEKSIRGPIAKSVHPVH